MSRSNKLLPYLFKNSLKLFAHSEFSGKTVSPSYGLYHLGPTVYKNFADVYSNVLRGIVEHDFEYLEAIMEPRLFEATKTCLDNVKDQNLKLHFLGTEDAEDATEDGEQETLKAKEPRILNIALNRQSPFYHSMTTKDFNETNEHTKQTKVMFDAYGVFGLRINRAENKGPEHYKAYTLLRGYKEFYYEKGHLKKLWENQVLILNAYFKTRSKIYVTNEEGNLVYGSDDPNKIEYHVWRFETYSPNVDWVLCDMDHYLKGNPYFKEQAVEDSEPEEEEKQ
eukprot:TRINITY_DN849_c0_g1_i1.p1 TRINITY_DN849_c0_g1~~TRINITY_DN849_c0_g1_i1.p1  ORF type:complete len:280 (+),score=48.12 TRINITY_DN849_c0_g1_i1:132-971(+)